MHNAEHKNHITKDLLFNIARVESNHNPKAVSKKGALGKYQIRYSVWNKELKKQGIIKNKQDLFNPEKNEKAAIYILTKYLNQTNNDLPLALQKYSGNARNYSRKVLEN